MTAEGQYDQSAAVTAKLQQTTEFTDWQTNKRRDNLQQTKDEDVERNLKMMRGRGVC